MGRAEARTMAVDMKGAPTLRRRVGHTMPSYRQCLHLRERAEFKLTLEHARKDMERSGQI